MEKNKNNNSTVVCTISIYVIVILVLISMVFTTTATAGDFRVAPTTMIKPITDVIGKNEVGIVELFMNNPSSNDVALNVDVTISVPSGIHVYGESLVKTGDAVSGMFIVPPGKAKTITVVIKADKTVSIGNHILQFAVNNNYGGGSLSYSVTVKEASNNPETAEYSMPESRITPTPQIPEDTKKIAAITDYINLVNSEIKNATSIGADTKAAVAKLDDARRALSKGDYNNASSFAGIAFQLSRTLGFISIKDLISSKETDIPKSKYEGYTVETSGLIRDIKSSGAKYNFVIDDGNGVLAVTYSGGLGDIKEGDSVYVKGIYYSQNVIAESVKKGSGLYGSDSSDNKTPGFVIILTGIGMILAIALRRK